jgi:hypothetical protein
MKSRVKKVSDVDNKIITKEIRTQIGEQLLIMEKDIDALVLWYLHEEYGWGKTRLKKFYKGFSHKIKELSDWYVMAEGDQAWLADYKLKECGIDVDEWKKEVN